MEMFNCFQTQELKEYLRNFLIHDANIADACYDRNNKILKIKLVNETFGEVMNFSFLEVKAMLFLAGDWHGSSTTVVALNVESDYSYVQNCVKSDELLNYIYIVMQTFNGDELYILAENLAIESESLTKANQG